MTMFILYLALAVFSFSEKLSSFAFAASKNYFALLSSMYSFLQENENANLASAVNVVLKLFNNSERTCSSQIWNKRNAFACFGELQLDI